MALPDCILHAGPVGSHGYGVVYVGPRGAAGTATDLAHRVAWEKVHGPVPEGMHLHHNCEVKLCINLAHLEVLTVAEHRARHAKTHCPQGHPYDEQNTRYKRHADGSVVRRCRACHCAEERARYARKRVKAST